jgi:vacuolar-type H+-ATPase subunit E/Vma4
MTKIVNEESFTVGRSIDCAISLSEDSISRVHLIVSRQGNQVVLEDKGSSNGTFINEHRMAQNTPVPVTDADNIRIGKSEYVLTIEVEAPENEADPIVKNFSIDGPVPAIQQVVSKIAEKPQIPKMPENRPADVIIHKVEANPDPRVPQRAAAVEKPETPYVDNAAMFEGERVLHEAHKKAAQIIYEGEAKAEKRVQAIYIQAREKQAEADSYYQKKISQAHKEANAIITTFQNQGQELIGSARHLAEEMRDEVELYVQNLRQKAKNEVEEILLEAKQEAEAMKNDTYEKALSKAGIDAEDMVANARAEAQDLLSFAKSQSEEMLTTARREISGQIKDLQAQADEKQKNLQHVRKEFEDFTIRAQSEREEHDARLSMENEEHIARLKTELEEHTARLKKENEEHVARLKKESEDHVSRVQKEKLEHVTRMQVERAEHEARMQNERDDFDRRAQKEAIAHDKRQQELQARFVALKLEVETSEKTLADAKEADAKLRKEMAGHNETIAELKKQTESLIVGKKSLESRYKELQEQLGRFQLDIQAAEEKKRHVENELEQLRQHNRERAEKETKQLAKQSEERLQDAQLELSKRMEKMERELFDEILSRKEKIVKEVVVVVETRIAKVLEPAKWDVVSGQVFEGVQAVIEGKAISFNGGTDAPKQSQSLMRKKKKEHLRWLSGGVAVGVALSFLGLHIRNMVTQDKNPMRTIAAEESRKKKEDLERRKFNPPQSPQVKDTYVDSVIYTSGYVAKYQDPEYQQKLYKAASAYLLKTWRVDEDKSIQVLSMASALVKELSEKKEAIHPDFVKEGLQKMRALEKSTLDRMKAALGSEVRLESFRRFENKFYEQESSAP